MINPRFDWESDCLKRIDLAFKFRKPAVVSTHRLNYMGYLNPKNRSENLMKLKSLLTKIKKYWPEVEFLSSNQLGGLMNKEN